MLARPARIAFLCCSLLLEQQGYSQTAPLIPKRPDRVEQYTLDNGLRVLLQVDHQVPLLTVSVWYHVGSFHEPKGGLAHLCEHLMFRGSKHVHDPHHGVLSQIGALHNNGSTTFHRTTYFETVPRDNLKTALWLESDRMGFLLDALDQEKLDREREVVKNERRQLFETAPYGIAEERFWHALFPRPHPYHSLIIGSMTDLSSVTLSDVRAFFSRHYVPSNATLAVVGDFEPAEARQLISRYFGTLPSHKKPAPLAAPRVALSGQVEVHHQEEVGAVPKLLIGWHSPPRFSPLDSTGEILATILSHSPVSRLRRRLVGSAGMLSEVVASQDSLEAQSVFKISALLRKGARSQDALLSIDEVLDDLRQNGVTDEELRRAKLRLITSHIIEMQQTERKAQHLMHDQRGIDDTMGQPVPRPSGLARYEQVTTQDVARFLNEVLHPARRVVLFAEPGPGDGGR